MDEITELLWDKHNVAHISRHDVRPREVQDVVFAEANLWDTADSYRPGRLTIYGWTSEGRALVVYLDTPTAAGHSYVVTARPMTNREERAVRSRMQEDSDD